MRVHMAGAHTGLATAWVHKPRPLQPAGLGPPRNAICRLTREYRLPLFRTTHPAESRSSIDFPADVNSLGSRTEKSQEHSRRHRPFNRAHPHQAYRLLSACAWGCARGASRARMAPSRTTQTVHTGCRASIHAGLRGMGSPLAPSHCARRTSPVNGGAAHEATQNARHHSDLRAEPSSSLSLAWNRLMRPAA